MLRIIAVFKLLKATLLIVVGIAALELSRPGMTERADNWLANLAFQTGEILPLRLISWIADVSPRHLGSIGIAAFVYATLFVVEGVNLWRGRRWAEYLTIIATASFIPLELYEVVHRFTGTRVAALVINVVVLIYLIWNVRRERREDS